MFISDTELIVRYAETDQMGVVHHSNYPIWFEAGRSDFFKKLGVDYSNVEEQGILLPLIGLKCDFKIPAKYQDEILIKTKLSGISCVRLTLCYEVFKKDDRVLIVTGETSHAWTDKSFKPINIKKARPDLYFMLESAVK